MVAMRAQKSITYAGKNYFAGDEFECSPKDAKILSAVRKAIYDTPNAKPLKQKVMVADVQKVEVVEPVAEPVVAPEPVVADTVVEAVAPEPEKVVEVVEEKAVEPENVSDFSDVTGYEAAAPVKRGKRT